MTCCGDDRSLYIPFGFSMELATRTLDIGMDMRLHTSHMLFN